MKYLASLALLLLMPLSLLARDSGGEIIINGLLTESGCDFAVTQQALNSACYRQGKWVRQSQPLASLTRSSVAQQSVQTELTWLDRQRGVIIVSYR